MQDERLWVALSVVPLCLDRLEANTAIPGIRLPVVMFKQEDGLRDNLGKRGTTEGPTRSGVIVMSTA